MNQDYNNNLENTPEVNGTPESGASPDEILQKAEEIMENLENPSENLSENAQVATEVPTAEMDGVPHSYTPGQEAVTAEPPVAEVPAATEPAAQPTAEAAAPTQNAPIFSQEDGAPAANTDYSGQPAVNEPPTPEQWNNNYYAPPTQPVPQPGQQITEAEGYYGEQKHYIPTSFPGYNAYDSGQPAGKPKGAKKGLLAALAIFLTVVVLVAGIGIGYFAANHNLLLPGDESGLRPRSENVIIRRGEAVERGDIEPDADGNFTATQVAQLVSDSVVSIQVFSETVPNRGSIASGVILDETGYIITNDHIYADIPNAQFIITKENGRSYRAEYVAGDQRGDIAVLRFIDMPDEITPAVFGDSSEVQSGDEVIAIGSPHGLASTVTRGIISRPTRRISFQSANRDGEAVAYSMRVIQTDTALNSGNSGGALVNMQGQVVGINSAKIVLEGHEGLCFAIPSNDAIRFAESLIRHHRVRGRARLGISYTEISGVSAIRNELPTGLLIQGIDEASSLANQRVNEGENGDIITEINGITITSAEVALDIIDDSAAGDTIRITLYNRATSNTRTVRAQLLEDGSVSSFQTAPERQPDPDGDDIEESDEDIPEGDGQPEPTRPRGGGGGPLDPFFDFFDSFE